MLSHNNNNDNSSSSNNNKDSLWVFNIFKCIESLLECQMLKLSWVSIVFGGKEWSLSFWFWKPAKHLVTLGHLKLYKKPGVQLCRHLKVKRCGVCVCVRGASVCHGTAIAMVPLVLLRVQPVSLTTLGPEPAWTCWDISDGEGSWFLITSSKLPLNFWTLWQVDDFLHEKSDFSNFFQFLDLFMFLFDSLDCFYCYEKYFILRLL